MQNESKNEKENFLYPIPGYHGEFSPQHLAFNANLQEFGQRVSLLCSLEANGKVYSEEAYQEIKQLWHQLKASKKELLNEKKDYDE